MKIFPHIYIFKKTFSLFFCHFFSFSHHLPLTNNQFYFTFFLALNFFLFLNDATACQLLLTQHCTYFFFNCLQLFTFTYNYPFSFFFNIFSLFSFLLCFFSPTLCDFFSFPHAFADVPFSSLFFVFVFFFFVFFFVAFIAYTH